MGGVLADEAPVWMGGIAALQLKQIGAISSAYSLSPVAERFSSKLAGETSVAARGGCGNRFTNFINWWNAGAENDAAWRALSLKEKVFYEVGQKTLTDGVWQKYAHCDTIARGRALVQDQGWLKALMPQGVGWKLGAGATLHTGPTPLVRWAVPRAAGAGVVGGAGYYLYKKENE